MKRKKFMALGLGLSLLRQTWRRRDAIKIIIKIFPRSQPEKRIHCGYLCFGVIAQCICHLEPLTSYSKRAQ
jgi:hypothetical protein